MSWTAPRTWTDGEIPTAAIMNAHVRDNARHLKGLDGETVLEDILRLNAATTQFATSPFYLSRYNAGEEYALKVQRDAADTGSLWVYDDNNSPAWCEVYHGGNLDNGHAHYGFSQSAASNVTTHGSWTDICSHAVVTTTGMYLLYATADVFLDASGDTDIQVRIQNDVSVGDSESPVAVLGPLSGDLRTRIGVWWIQALTNGDSTVRFQAYITAAGSPAGGSTIFGASGESFVNGTFLYTP